jgi:hypothetical protein
VLITLRSASAVPPKGESVDAILEQLQREAISFDEAMRRIRAVRGTTPPSKRGKKAEVGLKRDLPVLEGTRAESLFDFQRLLGVAFL